MLRFAAVAFFAVAPALAQQPFELATDGDQVTLSIGDAGLPLADFVKLAQAVTGRTFTYAEADFADAEPIKLTGTVKLKKDAFMAFFQTRLYVDGFATVIRGDGDDEVVEIVSLPGAEHHRPDDARYLPVADLERNRTSAAPILTSIPVEHVTPQIALDRVRTVLDASPNTALVGRAGKALVAQGRATDVYCIWRMVQLIDVEVDAAFQLVALKHARAAELADGLEALVAGREPAVKVLGHATQNALLISGPRAAVAQTVEIIELLDRPAAGAKIEKKKK